MEYINEGSTLPPPLNIVPTPKGIYKILKYILYWLVENKIKFSHVHEINAHINGDKKYGSCVKTNSCSIKKE